MLWFDYWVCSGESRPDIWNAYWQWSHQQGQSTWRFQVSGESCLQQNEGLVKKWNVYLFFASWKLLYLNFVLSNSVFFAPLISWVCFSCSPPVNPPREIEDPSAKKPADWDDREKSVLVFLLQQTLLHISSDIRKRKYMIWLVFAQLKQKTFFFFFFIIHQHVQEHIFLWHTTKLKICCHCLFSYFT